MYKLKREIVALGLAGSLFMSGWVQAGYAQTIYEQKNESTISSGVVHQHIQRFTETGWLNVNVVRVDLKNPNVDIDVVGSKNGITQRDVLTNIVQQKPNAVAAINADFFYMPKADSPMGITKLDSPIGVMVREGKMVSSPALVQPYNALSITNDGRALFGAWQNSMTVTAANGSAVNIGAYNKITYNYNLITVLDSNWGEYTPGTAPYYSDIVEVIVQGDQVSEVRQGQPAAPIPKDGYAIVASGEQGQVLLQNFAQGDSVKFNPSTNPNIGDIKTAVGGSGVILQNGVIGNLIGPMAGARARSAVGVNQAGDQLIIVAIDGNHKSYTGLDGKGMASLMTELGCYNALMLDGGGSTTFAARDLGEKQIELKNTPSDGAQRRIINGLVVASKGGTGEFGGLVFDDDDKKELYLNTPAVMRVDAFDTAYQPMDLPAGVVYSIVAGNGVIENNTIIPKSTGKITVQAEIMGKTTTKEFDVFEPPVSMQKDVLNQKPAKYDGKWLVYGGTNQAALNQAVKNKLATDYRCGIFTGAADLKMMAKSGKKTWNTYKGFNHIDSGNDLLVFLNTTGDGLRKSNSTQWPWLKNTLNSTNKKNVYLYLSKPIWGPSGFSDTLEAKLLGDELTKLYKRGINVYVFYGGGSVGTELKNGVRYIGLGFNQNQYVTMYKTGAVTNYTIDPLQ